MVGKAGKTVSIVGLVLGCIGVAMVIFIFIIDPYSMIRTILGGALGLGLGIPGLIFSIFGAAAKSKLGIVGVIVSLSVMIFGLLFFYGY